MGCVVSSETELQSLPLIQKFVGTESVPDYDPLWNKLLSFNLKLDLRSSTIAQEFDSHVADLLQSLMYNTQTTGNFSALIRVFLRMSGELRVSEQCENKIFLWQTSNCLTILWMIFKFLTERMNETEFIRAVSNYPLDAPEEKLLEDSSDEEEECERENKMDDLLEALAKILVDLPVTDLTMHIHIECTKCILALLSSQLYSENLNDSEVFNLFVSGKCKNCISQLSKVLLRNYLEHCVDLDSQKGPDSIVVSLATSFWNAVQFAAGVDSSNEERKEPATLGSLSTLLMLVLSCYHTKSSNAFRDVLGEFQNSQEVSSLSTPNPSLRLPFSQLYDRFCVTAEQEPPMLLLYLLLYRNSGFRNFILSRINLENLILPVLQILHDFGSHSKTNSHHMYLAIIVLLILSEDEFFSKVVHESMVKNVSWFDSDTPLSEISLGGLMALVLLRLIHRNAIKTRDRYLHTNCLAVLANMSAFFKQLCPLVCQRFIGLLEMLTKRHAKMVEHMRLSADLDVEDGQPENFHDDITALEGGIRTLLEITNSTLTTSLRYNPDLVYSLLYHRNLFDQFQQHPMFQDLMTNISAVIAYFSSKVVHLPSGDGPAIMAVIEKEVITWPTDRLAKFPELRFRYVEDENTADFFIPYVWRLALHHSDMRFEPARVKLFNALICS